MNLLIHDFSHIEETCYVVREIEKKLLLLP